MSDIRESVEEMTAASAPNGQSADGSVEKVASAPVRVGTLDEIRSQEVMTASGNGRVAAVFHHEGRVYAVDNRCPHMGFPLSRGSCKDGILTCEWHYARFDLATGGAFDLWAGDVDTYPVEVRNGDVWIDLGGALTKSRYAGRWRNRLREGLEQNLRLDCAKAVLGLLSANPSDAARDIVSTSAAYGLTRGSRRNSSGWGDGLTILTAMANMQPYLTESDRSLALYHGVRSVAEDAAGQMPRIDLTPLPVDDAPFSRLREWFREFIEVRSDEAADRVLRTAISRGVDAAQLIDLVGSAATDHYYRDFSHVMDTLAKTVELLDLIGWGRSAEVLPTLVNQLARSTREEEGNSWRHPEDLVGMVEAATAGLADAVDVAAPDGGWDGSILTGLLGDDPAAGIDAVVKAFQDGASLADVAQALAYASIVRIARFPTSNEFGDWDTALHHFTYCASLAQVARRAPSAELARGVLHGAMLVYQARFLNVPAARLPSDRQLDRMPSGPRQLLEDLSQCFERQGAVDEAGAVVYRHLTLGHDPKELIRELGNAVLREDPGFHDFQMLEEGVRLWQDLTDAGKTQESRQCLVAVARWQAAHSPTRRATTQTYDIALRLHRGEAIYESAAYAEEAAEAPA